MPLTSPPQLAKDQIVTLESGSIKKVQCRFVRTSGANWSIRVSRKIIDKLEPQQTVALLFANTEHIFNGESTIETIHRNSCHITVRTPEQVFARPRRIHLRKSTHLPAALILLGVPDHALPFTNEFVGRRNNMILNISKSGVLLGTTTPLPEDARNVLLIMGLNLLDPYNENNQVSVSGQVVRSNVPSPDERFPYGYGIKFKPTFPAFQGALEYFIDVILDEEIAI